MIYIIAYKDENGFDYQGLPWLTSLTDNKEDVIENAQRCIESGFKDVTIFSTDENTLERMENINWDFVNENKIEDITIL